MPKRSSKSKSSRRPEREGTPHDFTIVARRVVEQAIGEQLDGTPLEDQAVVESDEGEPSP